MMTLPLTQDLVLIGGGHSHALVLRMWGMKALAGARVTLINPGPTAPYTGMLPGYVAGHYTRDELDIDLVKLARFAGARLINGAVSAIDPVVKQITVSGQPPIAYDVCSIDVGITSAMPQLDGFADHGVPAKPLGSFSTKWDAYRVTTKNPKIAVIGGGVAGAELSMAMGFALRQAGHAPDVHLIDRGQVLSALGTTAREKMLEALQANTVTLIQDADVTKVSATGVHLASGDMIQADFVTGAAGAKPHDWQSDIGVDVVDGFIAVNPYLQSSDPTIFASGDCAHMLETPRPKAGVFAVRQAPVLFDNLRAALSGHALRKYKPQADYLKLISLGEKQALAEKFGTARSGALLWKWKDKIDRKFMDQFQALPTMKGPAVPRTHAMGLHEALGEKPMCGGCGAKVGREALRDVLATLPKTHRDDVELLSGDDAGLIHFGKARQVISTDHLRAFTLDPIRMTKIAAVHALGDVWAMGAKPQAATVNLILPRMSSDLQRRTMSDIMFAAQDVLGRAGAAIVGGHTSLGDELTVGFTVTGLCDADPITLTGAQDGDALILTKPIGSGVILAAEMQGQAKGRHVIAALDLMAQDQAEASRILSNANAMTDVTGFGLAGHLAGICQASGLGAELVADDVLRLDGAQALSDQGIRSSLFLDNVIGAGSVIGNTFDLLFDPQTAGGLLAAVPASKAAKTLSALKDAGYPAALIGTMTKGNGIKVR